MRHDIAKMALLSTLILTQSFLYADSNDIQKDKKITVISSSKDKDFIMDEGEFIMPSAGALANSLKMIFGDIKWSNFIEIKREEIGKNNQERALSLGIEGADLFFLAIAEDIDNLTKISGSTNLILNKIVLDKKSLNTTSRKKKLKKLRKHIKKGNWSIVLKEISSLKEEINRDFNNKKREDLALLNDVGGWLEGYRLTIEAMNKDYQPIESMILLQAPLINYLLKKVKSSNDLKNFSKREQLIEILEKINTVLGKSKNYQLSKDEVESLSKIFGGKVTL